MRIAWAAAAISIAGLASWALGSARAQSRAPAIADAGPARAAGSDAGSDYDRLCLPCHGAEGDGRGPAAAWLWPRPRDFASGSFKWRSTATGAPPTEDDVALSIRRGMPGTSMPGFGGILPEARIRALARRVLEMSEASRAAEPGAAVDIPEPPAAPASLAVRGGVLFDELGCAQCHGPEGRGDGPSASELRDGQGRPAIAWDLTAAPLRRPRPEGERAIVSIYRTLATGLSGTPMPAYAGAVPDDDLWAVAAYADAIRHRGERDALASTTVRDVAARRDRERRLVGTARWPGGGSPGDHVPFGGAIELQGEPPRSLAPAQSSLHARQCARCHKKQAREWRGSIHSRAGSPGLTAQLIAMQRAERFRQVESCQRCHNPLAEAMPALRPAQWGGDGPAEYRDNPRFDAALRAEGVNCATCHVRGWRRHAPASRPGSGLRDLPAYPKRELAIYGRSDLCMPCHQGTPRNSRFSGRPLLNTYREWLEGPYMPRGVQCQHCHMPNREHTFKGVHDRDTFRQAIQLDAIAGRSPQSGTVSVRARLWNAGAGHFLPTTPTPAVFLDVRLLDAGGEPIAGASETLRIGRHLALRGGMREVDDTRIPPGEFAELAAAWQRGRVPEARYAQIEVRVEPDEFYERFYERRLSRERPADERELYEEALARTRESHFTAVRRRVTIR